MLRQGGRRALYDNPLFERRVHRRGERGGDGDTVADPIMTTALGKWSWGGLYATDVQEFAHSAVLAGVTNTEVRDIAAMGGFGSSEQHINAQLRARYLAEMRLPQPTKISLPCLDPKAHTPGVVIEPHSVLDLHDMLHCMYMHHPDEFEQLVGIQHIGDFWGLVKPQDPKLRTHPMKGVVGWKQKFFPLLIHADKAEFHDRDSLLSISIAGLLGEGSTEFAKILFTSWPSSVTAHRDTGRSTTDVLWKRFCWCMNALYEGVVGCCRLFFFVGGVCKARRRAVSQYPAVTYKHNLAVAIQEYRDVAVATKNTAPWP